MNKKLKIQVKEALVVCRLDSRHSAVRMLSLLLRANATNSEVLETTKGLKPSYYSSDTYYTALAAVIHTAEAIERATMHRRVQRRADRAAVIERELRKKDPVIE